MSDVLTTIETKIKEYIETIVKPVTPVVGVYNYYSSTGTVNLEDESLSLASNTDNKMTNYTVYIDGPENNNLWSISQSAYTNTNIFRVEANVHLVGSEGNPKFEINAKMNEILSDFKYLFGNNHTLGGKCNWIRYIRAERQYSQTNNRILAAVLVLYFEVNYSQSINNPDLLACI